VKVLDVQNVNEAAQHGLTFLLNYGKEEESRNGRVLVAPTPVTTIYNRPLQRVLFSQTRDANPFFHLMEALWMLAGHNDIDFPARFNRRFKEYSDDGLMAWGAYGFRWREFFGYDQLAMIIAELRRNPTSRRCVLAMWNGMDTGERDLDVIENDLLTGIRGGRDVPCNTHAYFDVRGGVLNMTVCNRSNDAVWGAYGANAVHFSFLLEYMAEQIGVPVGVCRQISNNFHAYLEHYSRQKLADIVAECAKLNLYNIYNTQSIELMSTDPGWRESLEGFLDGNGDQTGNYFLDRVAMPMKTAWHNYKEGDVGRAADIIRDMPDCDWQIAALGWLSKREKKNVA